MIELTEAEKKVIKFCKGHFRHHFKTNDKIANFSYIFKEIYGWSIDDDSKNRNSYLKGFFNLLLDIYLKIKEPEQGNFGIKKLFEDIFDNKFSVFNDLTEIEKGIYSLISLISLTTVVDRNKNSRFILE